MAESTVEEHRGVRDRGLSPKDRTIEPKQAAQIEAARLKALAPGTYRHPDGSPPKRQDFEAFSRQYDQMANERHVWRFARPDGSTYETSWRGLGTGTTAQASASQLGHRVIGEVIPGPAVEGTPGRDAGGTRREPQLTRPPLARAEPPYSLPPLVQAGRPFRPPPLVPAEPPYTPPPLIQAKPPFDLLPWPHGNRDDDDQRGIANKLGAPTRSAKKNSGSLSASQQAAARSTSVSRAKWLKRALEKANLDLDSWQPGKGFAANLVNVQNVYKYYMRLFNNPSTHVRGDETLLWAGMAKLAGGVVYRGLRQSQQVLSVAETDYGLGGLEPPSARKAVATYVTVVQVILLQMQKEIFLDLAWQHQAYVEGGLPALEYAYARGENVPIEAWRDIASGNRVRVELGNEALLRREQETILPPFYKMIGDLPDMSVIPNVTSWFFAESPIPGGRKFRDVVPGGDVTQFRDRWLWITSDMLPAYLRLDPEFRRELVNRSLWKLGPFVPPAEE
jgi:hypothetical protein